jgi:hypothetical protein
MAQSHQGWCQAGLEQQICHRQHSWGKLPRGPGGGKDRKCPVCGANLSINPGDRGMWLVWSCKGGCEPAVVRDALEKIVDAECLGSYESGTWREEHAAKQQQKTRTHPGRTDPATVADARRFHAVLKLPADLNGQLLHMCIQAICECDGRPSSDPLDLLPVNKDDFCALADRAGIDRTYKYRLYTKWVSS